VAQETGPLAIESSCRIFDYLANEVAITEYTVTP